MTTLTTPADAALLAAHPKVLKAAVRAVLDLFAVDGPEFYFNEANDYGKVGLDLWTGPGDPSTLYRGEETQANYATKEGHSVLRGTGRYRLNAAAVALVVKQVRSKLPKSGTASLAPALEPTSPSPTPDLVGALEALLDPARRSLTVTIKAAREQLERARAQSAVAPTTHQPVLGACSVCWGSGVDLQGKPCPFALQHVADGRRIAPAATAQEPSDDQLRALWRAHGGTFHGPHIETGTMPESRLLPFLRKLSSASV